MAVRKKKKDDDTAIPELDMNRAVMYLRVSTDAEKQANSLEAQRSICQSWADRYGVTVVQVHHDEVSGAAALDQRPGLQRALADLSRLNAGLLLCLRLDRFSRDLREANDIQMRLVKSGARLALSDGGLPQPGPMEKFQRDILISVAELERQLIKARIKEAFSVKRARGESTGGRPLWGKSVQKVAGVKGGLLVDNDAEAETLEWMAKLRRSGTSLRTIVSLARERNLRNRKGTPFYLQQVWYLLETHYPGLNVGSTPVLLLGEEPMTLEDVHSLHDMLRTARGRGIDWDELQADLEAKKIRRGINRPLTRTWLQRWVRSDLPPLSSSPSVPDPEPPAPPLATSSP